MSASEITNLLLIVAIGLSVACLVKIHRLENGPPLRPVRREPRNLAGHGKLVDWPGRRPSQPRHHR